MADSDDAILIPKPGSGFDITKEEILGSHQGRAKARRLVHLACVAAGSGLVGSDAAEEALATIKSLDDIIFYEWATEELGFRPEDSDTFIDNANKRNTRELDRLQKEVLQNRDKWAPTKAFADFYASIGMAEGALALYSSLDGGDKAPTYALLRRELVLEMLLNHGYYEMDSGQPGLDVKEYLAECTVDLSVGQSAILGGNYDSEKTWFKAVVVRVAGMVSLCSALYHLHCGEFEDAANHLLVCGNEHGAIVATFLDPAELSLLTVLCALASLPDASVRLKLCNTSSFFYPHLRSKPFLGRLLDAYFVGRYPALCNYLTDISFQMHLNFRLFPHTATLISLIKDRSLAGLIPTFFPRLSLSVLAEFTKIDIEKLEIQVKRLIAQGKLAATLDEVNKIILKAPTQALSSAT